MSMERFTILLALLFLFGLFGCDNQEINMYYSTRHVRSGMDNIGLEKYEEAIADFDKAIELDSDNSYAYKLRGFAKHHLGFYQEAITDYDKTIKLDPNDTPAYYLRGSVKYELRQHFLAIADFDKAIKLNPNNVKCHPLFRPKISKVKRRFVFEIL